MEQINPGAFSKFDGGSYLDHLKKRAEHARDFQATRHQQDATETADLFNDRKSIGIYLRIFKRYRLDRYKLIECRDWVNKNARGNKGRLFVAVHKKFLGIQPTKTPVDKGRFAGA